ncbi:MAG: ABC transporter ATP-binding protein [Deinococcales bacterium]
MSAAGAPMFEARQVTKRFAGLLALSNVSFRHEAGEILGLIGPNGAGKTTLINLISGTLEPTSGALFFQGRPLQGLPPYRRAHLGIGRTFQIMKPFPGLSVLDNVTAGALFGRRPERDMAKARDAAAHWLEFVGLGDKLEQPADALGGPDRKRLELAKALALQPQLLLLDEVMAGLNAVEIDEVVALIRRIRDGGTTILVIEHVVKAIRQLSDRLLVLQYGELIAEGTAEEVLEDPKVIEAYLGRRRH